MNLVNISIDIAGRLALHELDRRLSVDTVGKPGLLLSPVDFFRFLAVRLLGRLGGLTPVGVNRPGTPVFDASRGYSITPTNCNFLQYSPHWLLS